ncbi:MAG: CoA-transferase [Firmicutes bacterium]|nr:CoA-transferase [Bacillota bacterium]
MNYGPAEMMVIALAREIKPGNTMFHGLASPVPMVACNLAKALHAPDSVYINIAGAVDPQPKELTKSTLDMNLALGSVAVFGLDELFDLSGAGRLDVVFLSGVQISQNGEINMSYIGGTFEQPKVRLPGGAGSASLTPTAKRALLWKTKHDKSGLVEKVAFCTARGNVDKVFTPLCTFKMVDGKLQVESVHPYSSLEEVKANTGWVIDQDEVPFTPPPTEEELEVLNRVDPKGIRYAEF